MHHHHHVTVSLRKQNPHEEESDLEGKEVIIRIPQTRLREANPTYLGVQTVTVFVCFNPLMREGEGVLALAIAEMQGSR